MSPRAGSVEQTPAENATPVPAPIALTRPKIPAIGSLGNRRPDLAGEKPGTPGEDSIPKPVAPAATATAVADLMTEPVLTVPPETTARKAANLMRGRSIGCLGPACGDTRLARQRSQAPNAQQMSALAVAIVKSSVPRGE